MDDDMTELEDLDDLDEVIAARFALLDHVEPPDMWDHARADRPAAGSRRRWLAVAAAAIVLVGGTAVLTGDRGDDEVTTSASTVPPASYVTLPPIERPADLQCRADAVLVDDDGRFVTDEVTCTTGIAGGAIYSWTSPADGGGMYALCFPDATDTCGRTDVGRATVEPDAGAVALAARARFDSDPTLVADIGTVEVVDALGVARSDGTVDTTGGGATLDDATGQAIVEQFADRVVVFLEASSADGPLPADTVRLRVSAPAVTPDGGVVVGTELACGVDCGFGGPFIVAAHDDGSAESITISGIQWDLDAPARVWRHPDREPGDGMDALIEGTVTYDRALDCFRLEPGGYPVVWPGGAQPITGSIGLRLAAGTPVGVGDWVIGGGGFLQAGDLAAEFDIPAGCVPESMEVAVFNPNSDLRVTGGPPTRQGGLLSDSDVAAILVAAVRARLEVNGGLGDDALPVEVVDHVGRMQADNVVFDEPRPLTEVERRAIADDLAPTPVRFMSLDAFTAAGERPAQNVVWVSEPVAIDADHVQLTAGYSCGEYCGNGGRYALERRPDGTWQVTGAVGPEWES